ncbi:MAG: heme ABC transporter ATP-binding protein [Planctomycetota bacterium]|nr:heme ABC transporter ATP-binding protein [Planctomycetota bacterium]
MLAIDNVTAGYGRRAVLQQVALRVAPGEFLGILGPNGCGKTTLLRVLGGVLPTSAGTVSLRDTDLRRFDRRRLARTMACLLQEFTLDLEFTVREVVLLGRSPHLPRFGIETKRDFDIAQQAMDRADVSHLADRLFPAISGGERQRVLLAMCLAQEPEVLLLDEPTSHLDIGHQLSILDLIARLNREAGMTVIAVFHDLNLAAEYCQRLLMMDRGRVAAVGTPVDVLTPETIRTVYGVAVRVDRNPLSGKPQVVLAAGLSQDRESAGSIATNSPRQGHLPGR